MAEPAPLQGRATDATPLTERLLMALWLEASRALRVGPRPDPLDARKLDDDQALGRPLALQRFDTPTGGRGNPRRTGRASLAGRFSCASNSAGSVLFMSLRTSAGMAEVSSSLWAARIRSGHLLGGRGSHSGGANLAAEPWRGPPTHRGAAVKRTAPCRRRKPGLPQLKLPQPGGLAIVRRHGKWIRNTACACPTAQKANSLQGEVA